MKNIHFKIDANGYVTPEINNGIIENENNVTLITATFPDSCQGFLKYLVFKTKKPVELIDGSKSRVPQVLLSDEGYLLPFAVVNAEIREVAFKALKEDGTCFTTEAVSFIPLCGTITSDSLAPAPIPTGFLFEEGENIGIEDSKQGSIRRVKIELKTPLRQKLLISDISGLETGLSSKQEKEAGKSLIADSEIIRLKNDLTGKASGVNTGDQDLSGLVPKTDIVTDFSGGIGKAAGAVETKALNENKLDKTGDSKDNTVTFSEVSAVANINSGEKHSVMFGKIKKFITDITATVRAVTLTGLSTAYYSTITAGDTVLSAFGKLQSQITIIGGRNAANGYAGLDANSRMALAQLPPEEGWITPTLLNGFTTETLNPIGYKKDINGEIIFRGKLIGGTSGATAFTLPSSPAGYRPANQIAGFQCPSSSTTNVFVQVLSTGSVVPYSTTGVPAGFYVDTVRFKGV